MMLIQKRILCAERVRRTPPSFSWVDHRLVRQRYLMRAPAEAWALYLVLVTAGDEHGLSYYSDVSVGRLLALRADEVAAARRQSCCHCITLRTARLRCCAAFFRLSVFGKRTGRISTSAL